MPAKMRLDDLSFFFFSGLAPRLTGSQVFNQGLNLCHSSESTESWPLGYQGTPLKNFLWAWSSWGSPGERCWCWTPPPSISHSPPGAHWSWFKSQSFFYNACMLNCFSRVWLFWDPIDCSPPGSSVHGILQARILEWVAMSSSRGSSWLRDWTPNSNVSCIGKQVLYH